MPGNIHISGNFLSLWFIIMSYLKIWRKCLYCSVGSKNWLCLFSFPFFPFHYAATQPPAITPLFLQGLDPLILLTFLFSVFHLLIFWIICKSHFGCSWYGQKRIQWKHRTRWFIYVSSFSIALIDIQLVQFSSYVGPRSIPGYKNTCLLSLFSLQHTCWNWLIACKGKILSYLTPNICLQPCYIA